MPIRWKIMGRTHDGESFDTHKSSPGMNPGKAKVIADTDGLRFEIHPPGSTIPAYLPGTDIQYYTPFRASSS